MTSKKLETKTSLNRIPKSLFNLIAML